MLDNKRPAKLSVEQQTFVRQARKEYGDFATRTQLSDLNFVKRGKVWSPAFITKNKAFKVFEGRTTVRGIYNLAVIDGPKAAHAALADLKTRSLQVA